VRVGARHLAALAVGGALLMSAGCGSSEEKKGEPLPQDDVAAIATRLDEVQRRYDAATDKGLPGACEDIEDDSYRAIDARVQGLPAAVDPDVRQALEESLARLQDLTRDGCSKVKQTRTEPETSPEETVPPPVPQEPLPEPTVTKETVPDPPKPTKDKKDKSDKENGGTEAPEAGGGGQPAPPIEEE